MFYSGVTILKSRTSAAYERDCCTTEMSYTPQHRRTRLRATIAR